MTPLLLSIGLYVVAFQLDNRWLAAVACAMQIWGTIILWKAVTAYMDGKVKAARHALKRGRGKRIRKPSHRV